MNTVNKIMKWIIAFLAAWLLSVSIIMFNNRDILQPLPKEDYPFGVFSAEGGGVLALLIIIVVVFGGGYLFTLILRRPR